jgi:hypothetical protein
MREDIQNLDQYLMEYGAILGKQAQAALNPLHDPAKDPNHPLIKKLLRKPIPAQAVVVTAIAKALNRQKSLFFIGDMGVGKTYAGQAAVYCHADGRPFRALIWAPGQLLLKWRRELFETIPGCYVKIIERCSDLLPLLDYGPPKCPEWYIIGRDTAKLGPGWRAAVVERTIEYTLEVAGEGGPEKVRKRGKVPHCPSCGAEVRRTTEKDPVGKLVTVEELNRRRTKCDKCAEPLWQYIRKPDRFEPAKFIQKKLRGFFDYLIIDELHEQKGADTAQANAVGSLAAAARKVLGMTGTLIGGYSEHIRPLLFRLSPGSLIEEGFQWKDAMPFNERYGRVETVITERTDGGDENRQSRGSSTNKAKYSRPGIMPTLFGAHLMGNAVFLGLQEMNVALPTLREFVVPIEIDPELRAAYNEVEGKLRAQVRIMLARRDKRLLGTMLQTLMAYPDFPFGWGGVGYDDRGQFVSVCAPPNLSPAVIRAKEKWFLDVVEQEATLGRQVWGYVQLNGNHDVESRLAELLRRREFRVKVLKHTIPLAQREEWIDKNCQDVDVVLSHPKLVETGLDLFSKSYLGHNFCTLAFYETGYVLPTMRQASRRAWRLMQPKECKVFYGFYQGTMQERAMQLMGKKLLAAEALEGKFSSEGLVAMAGDDGIEMALAKSLAENMDEKADRSWQQALDDGSRRSPQPRVSQRKELAVVE